MRKSERGEETGETDIRREGLCLYVSVCVYALVRQCVSVCGWMYAACTVVVLESRQFSSSSSPDTPRTKVVLQSRQFSASSSRLLRVQYYKVASSHIPAPQMLRAWREIQT